MRGLIGVVHVGAMPGDPRHRGEGFAGTRIRAMNDAERYVEGGVRGLVFENFGSAPFPKGTRGDRIPPHHAAALAILVREAKARWPQLSIGVNCLRNDARSALGIAAAAEANFIRVNVHTGAYVTDQGVIEGEAYETLRYRDELGGRHIAICADVLVKHASPLAPLTPKSAVHEAFDRGLADAIVVSGVATGAAVDVDLLREVRDAAGDRVVIIGSGLTVDNAATLTPLCNGAFVGTSLKKDGKVSNDVDVDRVKALAAAVRFR